MTPAIAYCIDSAYPMPLAVSLRSVLEHWTPGIPLELFILHAKVPAKSREKILASLPTSDFMKVNWISVDLALVAGLSAGLHYSSANYFRLLLPDLLPASVSAALYLDSDTVAVSDLSSLFALYEDKFAVQACLDYSGSIGNPLLKLPNPEAFGLRKTSPYFNSGVLLMNLKEWRKEKLGAKIMKLGRKHPEMLFFADQSAINICLHGRIGQLPSEWNVQTVHPKILDGSWDFPYLAQDFGHAKIIHYTTEFKPWSQGRNLPVAKHFHDVLARTAWQKV